MGYGFIRPTSQNVNDGKDIFVHFHYIVQRGFKTLIKGDIVEFSLGINENGVCAKDVKIVKWVEDILEEDKSNEKENESKKEIHG